MPHNCDRRCWNKVSLPSWQKYSPLSVPILLDWQRLVRWQHLLLDRRDLKCCLVSRVIYQRLDSRIDVIYVSPCGRQLVSLHLQVILQQQSSMAPSLSLSLSSDHWRRSNSFVRSPAVYVACFNPNYRDYPCSTVNATGMSTMEIMQFTFDPHCSVQSFKYSPQVGQLMYMHVC